LSVRTFYISERKLAHHLSPDYQLTLSGDNTTVRFFFAFLGVNECNRDLSPTMNLRISLSNNDNRSTVEEKENHGRELRAASHSYPPLLVIATPSDAEAEECAVPMRTLLCAFLHLTRPQPTTAPMSPVAPSRGSPTTRSRRLSKSQSRRRFSCV